MSKFKDRPQKENGKFWQELESSDPGFTEEVNIALGEMIAHRLFGEELYQKLVMIHAKYALNSKTEPLIEGERLLYDQYINFLETTDFEKITVSEFVEKMFKVYGIQLTLEEITQARRTATTVLYEKKE